MRKQFYILIGKSGSGKGTQAQLLKDYLFKKGVINVKHITTGGAMREFITDNKSYTHDLARPLLENGDLMPEFFAIWNWANAFINNINIEDSIILDGAPRALDEAYILQKAISYYGYIDLKVVYLDVSDAWAISRLEERGRSDDNNKGKVDKKMDWFGDKVLPVVNWYKSTDGLTNSFCHVNAERNIDEVNNDIIKWIQSHE